MSDQGGGPREDLTCSGALAHRALVLVLAVTLAGCVREGNAQTAAVGRGMRDDTTSVARLLNAVRGADPLLCELAINSVEMHGSWSRWGDLGGSPLEMDSTSAALIAWIQQSHNDPVVVPRLRTALRDSDACVRRVAGSFLGRVEHPTAVAALLAALDDGSADTRYVAAIGLGLGENHPAGVIDPLVRRLRDDSPLVRRSAAWSLGSLEATGALTSLIETLQRDPDARVRQAAAWAIGRLDD